MARRFEALGYRRLHVVDLDGARLRHVVNIRTLRQICEAAPGLTVDFGGGIRSDADLEQAFGAGAAMVTVGSIAVSEPDVMRRWIATYGPERFILGADVRRGKLATNGWLEQSDMDAADFIAHYHRQGIRQVLCTDISRDGTLAGPSTPLYRQLMADSPDLHLIASGGVGSDADILALQAAGIPAVVFGKAFYEGLITLTPHTL